MKYDEEEEEETEHTVDPVNQHILDSHYTDKGLSTSTQEKKEKAKERLKKEKREAKLKNGEAIVSLPVKSAEVEEVELEEDFESSESSEDSSEKAIGLSSSSAKTEEEEESSEEEESPEEEEEESLEEGDLIGEDDENWQIVQKDGKYYVEDPNDGSLYELSAGDFEEMEEIEMDDDTRTNTESNAHFTFTNRKRKRKEKEELKFPKRMSTGQKIKFNMTRLEKHSKRLNRLQSKETNHQDRRPESPETS